MSSDWQAIHEANVKAIRENRPIESGPLAGVPLGLLTTKGAKTGKEHAAVVTVSRDGDRFVIIASMGGAPTPPAWYHNLRRNPIATLEFGGEKLKARATVV